MQLIERVLYPLKLKKLAAEAGFDLQHVAFVTAYLDRSQSTFKRTAETLAWGTFAWFAGEPSKLWN